MKKKILIILGVIVLAFIGYIGYVMLTTKSHSPFKETSYKKQGMDLSIAYCQPYKKGRLIFGEESEGALQPFGNYWRVGANEATEITFGSDVNFGGEEVAAGTYRLYAVPGKDSWEISLNSELGKWGAMEPDYSLDVVKINVAPTESGAVTEQLTIDFNEAEDGVLMTIAWDQTVVSVPITN